MSMTNQSLLMISIYLTLILGVSAYLTWRFNRDSSSKGRDPSPIRSVELMVIPFFVLAIVLIPIWFAVQGSKQPGGPDYPVDPKLLGKIAALEADLSTLRESLKGQKANIDLQPVTALLESRLPDPGEWREHIRGTKTQSEGGAISSIPWLWISLVALVAVASLVAILIWPRKNAEQEYSKKVKLFLVLLPLIPVALKDIAVAYRTVWPATADAKKEHDKPSHESLVAFPFLFDLGGSARGTTLTKQQEADLRKILLSVKACAREGSVGSVELLVQGFADANEFPTDTRTKNLDLANRRARELHTRVAAFLKTKGLSSSISLKPFEWKTYEEMTSAPRYLTTRSFKETGKTLDQGLFNRRAEILLIKVGDCSPRISSIEKS